MRNLISLLLLVPVMAGCQSRKGKELTPAAAPQAPAQAASPAPAPVAAPIAPGTPMPKDATHAGVAASQGQAPAAAAETGSGETLQGKVLERIAASPYCYVRLKTSKGEAWAAIPEAKVEPGMDITVANPMLMTNFESKTLKRTFPEVFFGTLASGGASLPAAGGNPHAQVGQVPLTVKVGKVEKAQGPDARTVSEVWAHMDGLKEKTATLRGKVVKYSPGVMGKNWMHLQDGTGDAAKGTNDITVTTQDEAAKGDTVTVKGVVRTHKDFGGGYSYPVIIEDAKVIKK